ncbi:hypothetical protein WMY93_032407 [Mugilogobius chulae]|uniref:Snake toxin/toxin-like domain-containing protein n=1 Tax=Mugilogobius chulae TaxID=88201 RepID=A0AAW0MNB0_9GOBI
MSLDWLDSWRNVCSLGCPNLHTLRFLINFRLAGRFYKGCASDWYCEAAGYLYVSFSYGSNYLYYNFTCCNTNECNTPNLPEPPAGSLQCYSCDSDTYNCTSTVTCRDQELCFQTNYKNSSKTLHGCASEYLCSDSELSQSYFDGPLSCCNTSLCNGPEATAPSDLQENPEDSVFSGSEQMVAPALLLSLLLCSH